MFKSLTLIPFWSAFCRVLLVLPLVGITACTARYLASPSTSFHGEPPQVLASDTMALSFAYRASVWDYKSKTWSEEDFGIATTIGLGHRSDVKAYLNLGMRDSNDHPDSVIHRVFAGGLRVKWNPPYVERYLAFAAGGGVDFNLLYISYTTELAVMVGFENPYAVPYATFKWLYNDSPGDSYVTSTYGPQYIAGIEIPFGRTGLGLNVEAGTARYFERSDIFTGLSEWSIGARLNAKVGMDRFRPTRESE